MAFGKKTQKSEVLNQQGTMKKAPLSEVARSNKIAMICHLTESIIIAIAYMLELAKGTREFTYVLMIAVFAFVPPLLELIFYKKNKESVMVKHLVSYGFAVFYTFAMLTTNNKLTFVYVIPMIIAISVYNDFKYALKINLGVIILNIAQVAIFLSRGDYVFSRDSASIEIQVIVMIVFALFSVMTSKTLQTNNEIKLLKIQEESDEIEKILNNTMDISKKMAMDLSLMNEKIAVLKEAVERTSCAMAEVNEGSADTADAVQKQLFQTEGIQNRVDAVQDGAKSIIESMNQTRSAVATGNENVELLVNRVKDSVEAGKHVTNELQSLDEYMQKMNSIVDIITEITTQTSLLALNASIEAARAGEAGRGFAVVASEISKMADETQNAAVKITNLIGNVSSAIGKVVEVSADMINMIEGQNEATAQTAKSFQIIEGNTDAIYTHSNKLAEIVNHLSEANKEIVDSVSTVSAITEQVSAHASDTFEISEKNSATVAEVAELSNDLQRLAERLIN